MYAREITLMLNFCPLRDIAKIVKMEQSAAIQLTVTISNVSILCLTI